MTNVLLSGVTPLYLRLGGWEGVGWGVCVSCTVYIYVVAYKTVRCASYCTIWVWVLKPKILEYVVCTIVLYTYIEQYSISNLDVQFLVSLGNLLSIVRIKLLSNASDPKRSQIQTCSLQKFIWWNIQDSTVGSPACRNPSERLFMFRSIRVRASTTKHVQHVLYKHCTVPKGDLHI